MEKSKFFLMVKVKPNNRPDGTYPGGFDNPLKLSEVHLINKLVREHKEITVRLIETSSAAYKTIFG